ncbi:MAG: hypothetical protein ACRD0A_12815 [Acidimicrobiales bacterium]
MALPAAADEREHPPGDDPDWGESWSFEFLTDAGLGGYVTLTLFPALGTTWYWAYLVGDGGGPVAIIDDSAPLPRPPGSLELRTEGLWAVHVCETPLDHWTIGNEAFAVRFDDPDEALGRQRGDRVPLGLDLEWETAAPVVDLTGGYAVPCVVHGEVLVGHDRLAIDGWGWRDHRWGVIDWGGRRAAGRCDDGTWIDDPAGLVATSIERAPVPVPGGSVERALARVRTGDGRPGRAWLTNPDG